MTNQGPSGLGRIPASGKEPLFPQANQPSVMRVRLLLLAAAVLSASVLSVVPSSGADDPVVVSVFNNYFDESLTDNAVVGRPVTFAFQEGTHNAVAYQGGTFNTGLHAPDDRVDVVYNGGVIRYRCISHSNVNLNANPPICVGMCGVISDHPVDVTPPVVEMTQPKNGSINVVTPDIAGQGEVGFRLTFEGNASDDFGVFGVLVRLYDNAGKGREYSADCQFCPGRSAAWTVDVSLLPGSYLAEAVAADPAGNRATSRRIQIIVL